MAKRPEEKPLYVAKAELFKAIGHPVRIRILECLVSGPEPVSNLLSQIDVEPSALSQHLKVLKRTGLVTSTRRANSVIYRVSDPSVGKFLAAARAVLRSTLERARDTYDELVSP